MSDQAARPDFLAGVSTLFVDTSCLVYLLESGGVSNRGRVVASALDAAHRGGVRVVASVIAWTELLAGASGAASRDAARAFLADSSKVELEPVDVAVADEAARLRNCCRLPLADALQIATAIVAKADAVLTNDEAWRAIPACPRALILDELAFWFND